MSSSNQNYRRGMTLIEMLIATAVSLILMAAVAQVFAAFSGAMSNGRSILETDSRLRNVARRLRDDLNGATTQMLPPRTPDQGEGYFEVIEGPLNDYQDASNGGAALVSGTTEVCPTDIDDVLLFTTRDTESPFVGRLLSNTIESSTAEVAWFARATPSTSNPVTYTLYRKQLLVMGYVGVAPFNNNNQIAFPGTWSGYFGQPCDISARREIGTGFDRLVPNTLSDLTRREARFFHNSNGDTTGASFPYPFVDHLTTTPAGLVFDGTTRRGEDIILSNVLAFDVRVFDPAAPIGLSGSTAIVPGDTGSVGGSGSGAYVDLGHGVASNSLLTSPTITPYFSQPTRQVGGTNDSLTRTYCTWSTHYEADGINQDSEDDAFFDEGTDGLDNAPVNSLVDESSEQETQPPYAFPLRGVEVRIRVYEPKSRQVRQVTVRHTFVPH
ncbi:prepilin-type N-terminal cleavage/methylation domain-containing protein [Pirellulales bacterium]|nr:prepilin-type N-terminal cleavage/methylation domain-containing protein [Pirellulales bacterium]